MKKVDILKCESKAFVVHRKFEEDDKITSLFSFLRIAVLNEDASKLLEQDWTS